jgi:hypothetical protein
MSARDPSLPTVGTADGCCGGSAMTDASACCVLDEAKKREGKAGCECARPAAVAPAEVPETTGDDRAGTCCG